MKKIFALLLALTVATVIATCASAQAKFKDVPDDHWAASSVYDLVKLGVTKGYPDGTFRGTKQISRYETAILISKLAKAIGGGAGSDVSADISALKKEVAALKMRRAPAGGGMGLAGAFEANWKTANILSESGPYGRGAVASYRLKLTSAQELGEGANVIVNLDTMDYGFGSTMGGVLATQLLDIESNLVLDMAAMGLKNPVDVKLTYGPGARQHTDASGVLPSETGMVYDRPDTGVMASTKLWDMDVSGGYIAKSLAASGRVQTSHIVGSVGWNLKGVPMVNTMTLGITGDYISAGQFSSDTRDMRATVTVAAPLGSKVAASGKFGYGGPERQNWMVGGEVALNDVWDTGTVANITVSKVGSDYITDGFATECFDIAGLDNFDRPLLEGTVNLGGKVVQDVSNDVKLVGKGDLRLSGDYKYDNAIGRLTAEGGISYAVAPNTTLDAMYRVYQDKENNDTSDVAAVGLMYEF